jgi:hypothetical protein
LGSAAQKGLIFSNETTDSRNGGVCVAPVVVGPQVVRLAQVVDSSWVVGGPKAAAHAARPRARPALDFNGRYGHAPRRSSGILPVSRHGMRSYGHATACPRARRGVPVRFGCSRRFIPCSYGSKSSSIPSGVAHAVLAFVSGASWGNGVSPALVRSADARVLGVRLRLFYNGRRVAPSPLGGIGPVVLCHLPRASMPLERLQAAMDGR